MKPTVKPKANPTPAPVVPAAVARYYDKQDEHAERENALPVWLMQRVDMATFFTDDDEDELVTEIAVKEAAHRDALTFGASPAERHARMVAAAEARRRRIIAEEAL